MAEKVSGGSAQILQKQPKALSSATAVGTIQI